MSAAWAALAFRRATDTSTNSARSTSGNSISPDRPRRPFHRKRVADDRRPAPVALPGALQVGGAAPTHSPRVTRTQRHVHHRRRRTSPLRYRVKHLYSPRPAGDAFPGAAPRPPGRRGGDRGRSRCYWRGAAVDRAPDRRRTGALRAVPASPPAAQGADLPPRRRDMWGKVRGRNHPPGAGITGTKRTDSGKVPLNP
jgi:hypothetical protein